MIPQPAPFHLNINSDVEIFLHLVIFPENCGGQAEWVGAKLKVDFSSLAQYTMLAELSFQTNMFYDISL